MQKSIADKFTELEAENKKTEKQTQQSIESSQLLDSQTKESTTKKVEILKDLERVEMAAIDAQVKMKLIKKQHLGKVKSRASPAPCLKMAGIPRGKSSLIGGKGSRDVPLRQELRALEEATAIRKTKAWKNPQTEEVIMEAAGKSPLSGDVQREVTGKTKAWKTREQGPTSLSHPDHRWSPLPGAHLFPGTSRPAGRGSVPCRRRGHPGGASRPGTSCGKLPGRPRSRAPPPSPTSTIAEALSLEPTSSPAKVFQQGGGQFPAGVREDK